MDRRARTSHSFLPNINEIKSFIFFHEEYSQNFNRVFVKRYLSQTVAFQQQHSKLNDVPQQYMKEIDVMIYRLNKIDKNLSKGEKMDDNSCTVYYEPTAQSSNECAGRNIISMQSIKSALLSIECDPNINGSSSKSPVVNTLDHIRNNFKRNHQDETENVENNPPKKGKVNF